MDRYIEQLLDELNQLQQAASCGELNLAEILFDNISLEEEVALATFAPLHAIVGIRPAAFPPASLLANHNRISLLFALEDTLRASGYQPCYPMGTSSYARYEWLREQLSTEVPILKHHSWLLEWGNTDQTTSQPSLPTIWLS